MNVNNLAVDVLPAIAVMQRARDTRAKLSPLDTPMTEKEWHRRAEMIDKVIRERRELRVLQDRARALRDVLDRFKAQREAPRA